MRNRVKSMLLLLAVMLPAMAVYAPAAGMYSPQNPWADSPTEASAAPSLLSQPPIPDILALPIEGAQSDLRVPPFRFQTPEKLSTTLAIAIYSNRQKQYLYRAATLIPNFATHDIGFPFLAFW